MYDMVWIIIDIDTKVILFFFDCHLMYTYSRRDKI